MPRYAVDVIHQSRYILEDLMIDPLENVIMAAGFGGFNLVSIIYMAAAVREDRENGTREAKVLCDRLQVIHAVVR